MFSNDFDSLQPKSLLLWLLRAKNKHKARRLLQKWKVSRARRNARYLLQVRPPRLPLQLHVTVWWMAADYCVAFSVNSRGKYFDLLIPDRFSRVFGRRRSRLVGMLRARRQEQVPLPESGQHLPVAERGSGSSQANPVLCFLTEMVPLVGCSLVGQLGIVRSFKLMRICCWAFVLDTGKAANALSFLPSLRPAANLGLKLRENVEISSLPHQISLLPPPCFILVVRWVMAFVFGAFPCTFSQSSLSSLPLPFSRCPPFLCLMQRERNGQSNCCFSPVIHMEILISLLKESKTGQAKRMGWW